MDTYWLALWLIFVDSQINAEMWMLDSSSKCDKHYDTKFTESVDIKFKGGWSINGSCVISFLNNATNDYDIGVKILSSTLDCTTVIEYHKHFVSNYMHDGTITCKMNNAKGYKQNITQMSMFIIVFKKSEDNNGYITDFEHNEKAYIQVYRLPRYAEQPIERDASYLPNWVWILIVIGLLILVFFAICCCKHVLKKNEHFTILSAISVHFRKRKGASNEERLFSCFGYEVLKSEMERLKQGCLLDDSIVNVLLRNEKENHSDVAFFDSTFARKYLVPKNTTDSGCHLQLTASDLEEVQSLLNLDSLRLIVLPVCNINYWFLAAFSPCKRIIYIVCSLGNKPEKEADSLKRFFQYIYGDEEIQIEYPNVPRQENSADCGVCVIEHGINLMKTSEPNWSTMVKGNRDKIVHLIEKLYEKCHEAV